MDTQLGFGTDIAALGTSAGLIALDKCFLGHLAGHDAGLQARLLAARAAPEALEPLAESHLIMALGPVLEDFVSQLFGLEEALEALVARTRQLDPVHACKRLFVQRQAVKKFPTRPASTAPPCARRWKPR